MNDHLLPLIYQKAVVSETVQRIYRHLATYLYALYASGLRSPEAEEPVSGPIQVVCISDTHNATLDVPEGDILIHAGDLTQKGTFEEVQAQLKWLGSLRHKHKVVIAGNHDTILDADYCDRFPAWSQAGSGSSREDLDWFGCLYLQDETAVLDFPETGRTLTIYGSPKTPDCGTWAFQYPAVRDVWSGKIPENVDVVVTHSPPVLHRDGDMAGDGYLLTELRRVKPRLHVFGHIHEGYGVDVLWHNAAQSAIESIYLNRSSLWNLVKLSGYLIAQISAFWRPTSDARTTRLVNAAVAPSRLDRQQKRAIKVLI